ncbi:MAG: hypothetical protein R6V08_11430 [Desulfuromonadales bacterium]
MGVTFFVATAGLVVAGYFGYRKLQKIEDEIREDLESRDEAETSGAGTGKTPEMTPAVKKEMPSPVNEASKEEIEALVLEKVRQSPGILQTEIYNAFAGRYRKELQGMMLKMDREGRLRREKKGSTYRLFPV